MSQRFVSVIAALAAVASLCAADPVSPPATTTWRDVAGVRVPVLKMPLYVMEFHVWYDAPVGPEGRPGWFHGGMTERAETDSMGPDWMRMRKGVGWPLPGSYESGDPGIIRWQLRCLKATGVDGVFIQLFANWTRPEVFLRTVEFETILHIAEEEGLKVAIHDEVQFRNPPAKDPVNMAKRAGDALRKYGSSPAYLRIAGKPAYAFQWWGQLKGGDFPGESHEQLQGMMQKADEIAGQASFWMPFRHMSDRTLMALPEYGGGVVMSNCNNQFRVVRPDAEPNQGGRFPVSPGFVDGVPSPVMVAKEVELLAKTRKDFPNKKLGLWAYPAFNNSTQHGNSDPITWLPRRGGQTLAEALAAFQEYGCDFIMLSSWNDWEENTAIEPGFMYDGFTGDPYLSCRIVAAAKDRDFVPPPLPPKESVDPLMWQRLYGIDRTPPRISRSRYLPLEPALIVEAIDSGSAVAGVSARTTGDWWCAATGDAATAGPGLRVRSKTPVTDGAWQVAHNQTLEFDLDREALRGQDRLWLAIEFTGTAKGSLAVTYPSSVERADNRPTDENRVEMKSYFAVPGTNAWSAESRLLRAVSVAQGKPLVIRYNGEGGTASIARVHLFRVQPAGAPEKLAANAIVGLEISGVPATSQVKSFRLAVPNLRAPASSAVYLEVRDAAGNATQPMPFNSASFANTLANVP